MTWQFTLPDTGEGLHEAEILEVLVHEGDAVEEGQNVLVVETDKASLELPAPESGVIEKIYVDAGDTATVGDVLISFADADGNAGKEAKSKTDETDEKEDDTPRQKQATGDSDKAKDDRGSDGTKAETADASRPEERTETEQEAYGDDSRTVDEDSDGKSAQATDRDTDGKPVRSVPATRRLARDLGVDLHEVTPTGPHGRVTDEDVRKAADRHGGSGAVASELPDFGKWGDVDREKLRSIRRTTADRMSRAWRTIPHVNHMDAVAIDGLEEFRRRHVNDADDKGGDDLTLTAFVVKALGAVLRDHPRFNASLDMQAGEIVYKRYCHIGVAVASDRGLLVPVVRDVDRKTVLDIAEEIADLADRVRSGAISRDELSGGSFTVTNVGPLGGRAFTPIINWPEVAILGLGRARLEPVAERRGTGEIQFVPRLMLPLCLAFDHRVNDGADAARFMASLMEILADPDQFILAA